MLPLRYVHRWRIVGVCLLAIAFAVALLPEFWSQVDVKDMAGIDKWLHAFAFMLLTVWFSGQYARRSYPRMTLGLLVFGALIEAVQYLTYYRSAEWADLYADAAGIALGLVVAILGSGGWSLRFERWLASRGGERSHG